MADGGENELAQRGMRWLTSKGIPKPTDTQVKYWEDLDLKTALEEIQELKTKGNRLFREKRYQLAMVKYEEAMQGIMISRGTNEADVKKASHIKCSILICLGMCHMEMDADEMTADTINKMFTANEEKREWRKRVKTLFQHKDSMEAVEAERVPARQAERVPATQAERVPAALDVGSAAARTSFYTIVFVIFSSLVLGYFTYLVSYWFLH